MGSWFIAALLSSHVALAEEPAGEESASAETAPAETAPAAAETLTYTLDPKQSWLYVLVYADPDRWTPITAHDHGIRATDFTGTVTWNRDDPSVCDVAISFPVGALRVDPPGMRERAGFSADGAIKEDTKATVIGNMLGRKQLDAANFGTIAFQSTGCSGGPDTVRVAGNLTVHGVSKAIAVDMKIAVTDGRFGAKGGFDLTHADFGMSPFTYGPGTPKNKEQLTFGLDLVGSPK